MLTSISKLCLSQYWERPVCSSTPTAEVWTKFEKPQAPAALTETGEEHRECVPSFQSSVSRFQIFLTRDVNARLPCPQNKSYSGEGEPGSSQTLRQGVRPRAQGRAAPLPCRRLPPGPSPTEARPEAGTGTRDHSSASHLAARAPPEEGGASGRRGEAGRGVGWGELLRGPARSRAFPARSPASCVLWSRPPPLPCWIVRPPPPPLLPPKKVWRRSWEFSAVARERRQRPSGRSLAGREPGASLSLRGPSLAPPSRGLLLPAPEELRDAAPLIPLLLPLSPRGERALAYSPETALDSQPRQRNHELRPAAAAAAAEGHQCGVLAAHPAGE